MKRFVVAVFVLGLAPGALAQAPIRVATFDPGAQWARGAEDYARARPLPLPRVHVAPGALEARTERSAGVARPTADTAGPAARPTLPLAIRAGFRTVLYQPPAPGTRAAVLADRPDGAAPEGKVYGTGGLDFTSSRLIPGSIATRYPYSAVGKIFFGDGTDLFTCTGAVLSKRLVLTAAHCVHEGAGGGFFQDFEFVPAYEDGVAPLGVWQGRAAFVTDRWASEGDIPFPQDWALLEIADQGGVSIADVTGTFTYGLDRLADNHLHLLGYPGNLDEGELMHVVASGDFFEFDDDTVVYGSDMAGGSSGGPWIQNLSRRSRGQAGGSQRRPLVIVGVTSYGFEEPSIMAQGASVLTGDFAALHADACAHTPGNC